MRAKADFSGVIKFAARSGFLTWDLWDEFFAHGKACWRRRQWSHLKARGYFLLHSSKHSLETLVLNPHSKTVQNITGGFREKPPYLAKIHHDETVLKGLMRLARDGRIKRFVLEKQLRRENTTSFDVSSWRKYPDAIVHLQSDKAVAIEVELRQKSKARYREIFRHYRTVKEVAEIVYLCESSEIERAVKSVAQAFIKQLPPIRYDQVSKWIASPESIIR